ncbi:MAG: hypothetical protein ACTSPB_10135 [Candidatus Thorarchaeota archaeon]
MSETREAIYKRLHQAFYENIGKVEHDEISQEGYSLRLHDFFVQIEDSLNELIALNRTFLIPRGSILDATIRGKEMKVLFFLIDYIPMPDSKTHTKLKYTIFALDNDNMLNVIHEEINLATP